MKITNRFGLSAATVRAVSNQRPWLPMKISVTQLITPPQVGYLERVHDDEREEDAGDRLFLLDGLADHYILEHANSDGLAEESLEITVKANPGLVFPLELWRVTGQPDLLEGTAELDHNILTDYKRTSIAATYSLKPEWEQQVNLYALLYRMNGFKVAEARIEARLRDWVKGRAHGHDYPPIAAKIIPVPLWPDDRVWAFLGERLNDHARTWHGDVRPCTAQERWERDPTFAVMKEGRKSALRVLDTEILAGIWCLENGHASPLTPTSGQMVALNKGISIVKRPGGSRRCEEYCSVLRWCAQGQALVNKENDSDR